MNERTNEVNPGPPSPARAFGGLAPTVHTWPHRVQCIALPTHLLPSPLGGAHDRFGVSLGPPELAAAASRWVGRARAAGKWPGQRARGPGLADSGGRGANSCFCSHPEQDPGSSCPAPHPAPSPLSCPPSCPLPSSPPSPSSACAPGPLPMPSARWRGGGGAVRGGRGGEGRGWLAVPRARRGGLLACVQPGRARPSSSKLRLGPGGLVSMVRPEAGAGSIPSPLALGGPTPALGRGVPAPRLPN